MKAIIKKNNIVLVQEIKKPTPKENEVLVNVALTGFCRTDAYVAQGIKKSSENIILGHEFSGVIVECGNKVDSSLLGKRVAVMPILKNDENRYVGKMLGVNLNGGFADFVSVPFEMIYIIPESLSFIHAAYAEPVAASLAVVKIPLDKNGKGAVVGNNRITKLTFSILKSYGYSNIEMLSIEELKNTKDNNFDYIIETFLNSEYIDEIMRTIKPKGTCILKSRSQDKTKVHLGTAVEKEINFSGAFYGNFQEALDLLIEKKIDIDSYLGKIITLEEGVKILMSDLSNYEEKKIFFTNNQKFLCAG